MDRVTEARSPSQPPDPNPVPGDDSPLDDDATQLWAAPLDLWLGSHDDHRQTIVVRWCVRRAVLCQPDCDPPPEPVSIADRIAEPLPTRWCLDPNHRAHAPPPRV